MNIYAWSGLIGIFVIMALILLPKSGRTEENKQNFIKVTVIILIVIALTTLLNIHFAISYLIGIFLYIVFDKKTYTKKRLIIYGSIVAVLTIIFFILFRYNPSYTLKHLANNPDSTSLYVSLNNEEVISYEADVPRPLASVVKIVIAIEYAYQLDNDALSKDDLVSLDDLDKYYLENTDGGAHKDWLEDMEDRNKIDNNQASLHDVAKGMIEFSSNANTDYLINLLEIDNINERISDLGLTDHDDVYPLVGGLLASYDYKKEQGDEWIDQLKNKSDEEYEDLALDYSEKMKNEEMDLENLEEISRKEHRIWSDRLPKASAQDYGQLLNQISNGDFPEEVNETVQNLMEWPEDHGEAFEDFDAVGAKGGSTAFVLNQAMYFETEDGDKVEIALLMNDLNSWQFFMQGNHVVSFILELVEDEAFLEKAQDQLSD